jgi:hypothetical protein
MPHKSTFHPIYPQLDGGGTGQEILSNWARGGGGVKGMVLKNLTRSTVSSMYQLVVRSDYVKRLDNLKK